MSDTKWTMAQRKEFVIKKKKWDKKRLAEIRAGKRDPGQYPGPYPPNK